MDKSKTNGFLLPVIAACVLLAVLSGCVDRFGKTGSLADLYVDAMALQEAGYPNEAIKKLDTAIEKDEQFSQAYSLKGDIYQQSQQYERSADSYKKATEYNPWSFYDFFNLGKVYQAMQEFARAVQAYVRACELRPEHLQAHINTAKCYNELGRYDDALVYAQRAEQIDPSVIELHRLLGDAYEGKKDYEQAIASYKRALEMDADDPQAMIPLAVAYLKTERPEPARELLTAVIELSPNNGRAYRHLGYSYLKLYEDKASEYRRLLQQGSDERQYMQGLVQQGSEMVAKAVENYSQAIEINPNDWDAHRGLGVAYIIEGKAPDGTVDDFLKNQAIEHWRRSLQINPDQPGADRLRQLIAKYRTS